MQKHLTLVSLCLCAGLLFLGISETTVAQQQNQSDASSSSGTGNAPIQDGVVAHVNDGVILGSEVRKQARPLLEQVARRAQNRREARQQQQQVIMQTLANMMMERVVEDAAEERGIEITEQDIQQEMFRTIDSRENLENPEDFEQALRNQERTLEQWKQNQRRALLMDRLFRHHMQENSGGNQFIKPSDIRAYYEENREEFYVEGEASGVRISREFRRESEKEQIIEQMKELKRMVNQGADLDTTLDSFQENFDLQVQQLNVSEFDEELHAREKNLLFQELEPGDMSDPTVVNGEVVLIQLNSRSVGQQRAFSDPEVQSQIRQQLRQENFSEQQQQLQEQLVENAYLEPRHLVEEFLE